MFLHVNTAFLHVGLIEAEDGLVVVQPPAVLVMLVMMRPGIMWKLNNALCGLRDAPKRWSQTRGHVLNDELVVRKQA